MAVGDEPHVFFRYGGYRDDYVDDEYMGKDIYGGIDNARLHLVPAVRGVPSGYGVPTGWAKASSVFLADPDTLDTVMALTASDWSTHGQKSKVDDLLAAIDVTLAANGYTVL